MINTTDISVAERVCNDLSMTLGPCMVQAKDGSGLAQLDATTPIEAYAEFKEDQLVAPIDLVEATARKNLSGIYEHDIVLEGLVDKAYAVIDQRTQITRDRAIPMVSSIIAGLNKVYNLSFTEANVFTIQELGLPPGISSEVVSRLIGTYADSKYPRVPIDSSSPNSQVRLTSENDIDSVGASEQLVEVFNKLYVDKSEGLLGDSNTLNDAVRMLFWNASELVPSYESARLLAIQLMVADLLLNAEELPSGITGYATAINNFLQGEAAYAAKQLKIVESYRDSQLARKQLIAGIDNYGLVIKVNADVYRAWLEMGGTAEALIGYVAEKAPLEGHYDAILDNLSKYTECYNVHKLKLCDAVEANQLTIYKKNLPFQLQSALIEDGFTQEQVTGIVNACADDIKGISTVVGERFYMSVLHIVSEFVYPGLEVAKIAREMNRIATAIPGISPAQANELVMGDMLLDYIASQLVVTRVG